MSSEPAVSVRNLVKRYENYGSPVRRFAKAIGIPVKGKTGFSALSDVSFDVADGATVGILGANGSGKSTLLQVIAGTSMPTAGTVTTRGKVAGILELGAGFLPDLTGRENALLNARLLGLDGDEARLRLPWIENFADIGEHIDVPVRTYSSGMFVRLAFAVAASVDPDILIVDEAMAVGDIAFQQKCYAHMRTKMAKAARIFVSHDVAVLPSICERSIVLSKGRIVYDGPTRDAVIEYLKLAHQQRTLSAPDLNPLSSSLSGPREIDVEAASFTVEGRAVSVVAPGERVTVSVSAASHKTDVAHAVLGMNWMDETGRIVFGRNTADQNIDMNVVPGGNRLEMSFIWPRVRPGTYACTIGIADRDHPDGPYRLQCWAHRAFEIDAVIGEDVHGIFAMDIETASAVPG